MDIENPQYIPQLNISTVENQGNEIMASQRTRKTLEESLNELFPTHKEETKIQKARRILEEVAGGVTDQELEIFLTQIQFLIDTWTDRIEKEIFKGLTLREILKK